MRTWLQRRFQLFLTTIGFVLAAGGSVLVNVWTEGWVWTVGVGIAALIVFQVVVEGVRSGIAAPRLGPRKKTTANQAFNGINRAHPGCNAEVRQRFKDVHNSRIVGIDEVDLS